MRKQLSTTSKKHWVLAHCPKTGEEVVGSSWHTSLLNLEALPLWFYCPACKSWHIKKLSRPQPALTKAV